MTDEQRRALVLRFGLDGGNEGPRTDAEVAQALGIDEKQAQKLIAAACKDLGIKAATSPAQVHAALIAHDQG